MVQKRKAVCKSAGKLFNVSKEVPHEEEPDMDVDPEEEDAQEETPNEAVSLKQREAEASAARKKELKAMSAEEINKLLLDRGLEKSNKSENVEKILKAEAKDRKAARDHEAKIRAIVTSKKEELEALSVSELAKQCNAIGIKGTLSKQARVESLLKQWLQDDGINKTLAQKAHDERKEELIGMDSSSLVKLCNKLGIDAFVTEVMIERILKRETEAGRFSRPVLDDKTTRDAQESETKSTDVVAALLANEAARKKQLEEKQKEEEEAAQKIKELRGKSKEELEKLLKKKGLEATGKKDDMVAALYADLEAEKKLTTRKAELQALGKNALKEICATKRLETSSKVEDMIKTVLNHEKKCREKIKAYEAECLAVAEELIAKKREELTLKSSSELKDMLVAKGLKTGVGKEERVERLLEDEKNKTDEVDKILLARAKNSRRAELLGLESKSLKVLCEELGADPFVKEVAIERIIDAEAEAPAIREEPPAKRSKK